jgi:hypothetical protein
MPRCWEGPVLTGLLARVQLKSFRFMAKASLPHQSQQREKNLKNSAGSY